MQNQMKKAAPDDCSIENGSGEKCARAGIMISVNDCSTGKDKAQEICSSARPKRH